MQLFCVAQRSRDNHDNVRHLVCREKIETYMCGLLVSSINASILATSRVDVHDLNDLCDVGNMMALEVWTHILPRGSGELV